MVVSIDEVFFGEKSMLSGTVAPHFSSTLVIVGSVQKRIMVELSVIEFAPIGGAVLRVRVKSADHLSHFAYAFQNKI